jgi:hypothetical protein
MYAAKKSCTPFLIAVSVSAVRVGAGVEATVVCPEIVGRGAAGPSAGVLVCGEEGSACVVFDATGADTEFVHAIVTLVITASPRRRRRDRLARRLIALFKQADRCVVRRPHG